jgi:hypothetical protein
MFGALPCLSGASSCGEQCPPDTFFTEAHIPGTRMTAQLNWFHCDWICEALCFWCPAVLACAVELQLLRSVRTRSRPNLAEVAVHCFSRSVDSHWCLSAMNPASRLALVTCARVEAHVPGDDEYRARFRCAFNAKAHGCPRSAW